MNRIICDICGSEYPETDERCPICNYPRQGNEKLVAAAPGAVRGKVKGGRFSSKNVEKRLKEQEKAGQTPNSDDPNRPLRIVIALLLCAIVLVSVYIGLRFFRGRNAFPDAEKPQTGTSAAVPTGTTVPPTVPCADIVLDAAVLDLEEPGQQLKLDVKLIPADTTDAIGFRSADPAVAEVSETGIVTAVGPGQTTITITCGAVEKTCTVVCWFREETTAPTETTVPQPTETTAPQTPEPEPNEPKGLSFSQNDVSCFTENETFTLTVKLGDSTISRSKVTWTTSDPAVATVENGVVTAVGKGTATITGSYGGEKASCTVRCRFEDSSWTASATDVTLSVGESFRLTVTNGSGESANAVWTMSTEGIVSVSGSTVTGQKTGTVTLTANVDGASVSCIVRVIEP